jgi:hypothetical protein
MNVRYYAGLLWVFGYFRATIGRWVCLIFDICEPLTVRPNGFRGDLGGRCIVDLLLG